MAGDWRMDRIINHGAGIYRITDRSDAAFPPGALWDALNCVYESESDNPEAMRGATRVGTTAMGGYVTAIFDYDNGTKLCASCSDGKFYEYTTDWAAAATGARKSGNNTTTTTRWHDCMFYGATTAKDLLVVCNGIDAPAKYETSTGWTSLGGSPPATGNYPTEFMGRLWLASGDVVYASAPNDCENWTIALGAKQMVVGRGIDGNITGMFQHGGAMLVFKRSSVWRIRPTQTFTAADIMCVSDNIGCISNQTITQCGAEGAIDLVFASEQGLEMIHSTTTDVGINIQNISRGVKPIIEMRNKDTMSISWCLFNIDRRELYFNYPGATKVVPTVGLVANFARPRSAPRWTRMDRPNLTCGVIWKEDGTDYVQLAGDTDGRVHRMHVKTATAWSGSPYAGRIITPYHVQGAPERMKEYGYTWLDVQTEADYSVPVKQILMRRGLPSASNVATLAVTGVASGWGEGYWGTAVWGGTGYAGERIRPPQVRRGSGISHIIESTRWFRLNAEVVAYNYKTDQIAA